MIIKIYADRIAEIHLDPAEEVPHAMDLVRALIAKGAIAAKIVRIQTEKEIPPPRFDQEGGGPVPS